MERNLNYGSPPENLLGLVRWLPRRYRNRALSTLLLLVAAGLAEGVGILTLLPLLEGAEEAEASGAAAIVTEFLRLFGARPAPGPLLLILVGGVVLKALLSLVATRRAGFLGVDISRDVRLDFAKSLTETRWEFFSRQHVGSLTNSIGNEAARATDFFVNLSLAGSNAVQGGIYLILAFFTSPTVSVAALIFGTILLLALTGFVRVARKAGEHQANVVKAMTGRLADAVGSIKPLKAMGRTQFVRQVLEADVASIAKHERQQTAARTMVPALQEPLIALGLAAGVYVALTYRGVPIPELIFLALLFQRTVSRLATAQSFYQTARIVEAPFKLVLRVISEADRVFEKRFGTLMPSLKEKVKFDDVTFAYGERPVLLGFSAEIPVGLLTTIIGPSGAGKTTLLDLLCGLLEPQTGAVRIDGMDLRDVDLHSWRRRIGYVPQEMTLLHDSVLENVRLGNTALTHDDVVRSLRSAGADEFVMRLPEGIHTIVGERGSSLSGGQRQRLALARALVVEPEVLILDEVTTALDPVTEAAICNTILQLRGACTIVAISHQPALVTAADHVVEVAAHTLKSSESASDQK